MENKCWQECEEIGYFSIAYGNVNHAVTMQNSTVIPQKINIEFPYDPVILLLCICPKEMKVRT